MGSRLLITATLPETIGKFVAPQLPALVEAGFDVHVATSEGDWFGGEPSEPVQVHVVPMVRPAAPLRDLRALSRWDRLISRLAPDLVLASTPKAGLLSLMAAHRRRVPRRIFLHRGAPWETLSGPSSLVYRSADRLTLTAATETLAVSDSLADLLVEKKVAKGKPTVLGLGSSKGVNLHQFTPAHSPPPDPVIGYLGRLSSDKGIEQLLQVFDIARSRVPQLRLRLAGYPDARTPIADSILARIQTDPAIEWSGTTSDPAGFMREIRALVFPSHREGLPNVVIEAAAVGVPTVGWQVTGVRDAISPRSSGSLVPYGDVSAMAGEVLHWLSRDPYETQALARAWAHHFNEEAVTKNLVNYLLQSAVAPPDTGRGEGATGQIQ